MEQGGSIVMSAERLCIISHKNRPRTKWLPYIEGGCEEKGTSFEVVGSDDCRNGGFTDLWASRLNVFVALGFPGWEIKEGWCTENWPVSHPCGTSAG